MRKPRRHRQIQKAGWIAFSIALVKTIGAILIAYLNNR